MKSIALKNLNKNISWTAILVGAIVGLGLNFLLNLLSLSIGLSLFTYTDVNNTVVSFSGLIGFLLVGIISMFSAGWTAGLLSRNIQRSKSWGILYGFTAWCTSLIITTILLTNMIQFAAFHGNFTSQPDLVAVRIANDQPMMTETSNKQTRSSSVIASIEKKSKIITLNSTFTFLLFFTGAISSCIGGYVGFSKVRIKKR